MEKEQRFTPDFITELKRNQVFVFGSNLGGLHMGGAAALAHDKFGAVWGQGVGLQGQSYAIPTMQGGVETIKPYVDEFIEFTKSHQHLIFLVTKIGCVDKDTEFLTPFGWKKISEYTKGDKVGQYDVNSEIVDFVEPLAYIKEPCTEFIHFVTKYGIDQMLSPEHKCIVINNWSKQKEIITAQEIFDKHHLNVNGYTGKFITTFKTNRCGIELSDEVIRVLVMISADGSVAYNKIWLKFRKKRKINRAIKLLREAGIEHKVIKHKFETGIVFNKTDIIDKISFKRFWECNPHQLEVISEEVLLWDGNQKNIFYTRKKDDADFIHYCFSACGKRATLITDVREYGVDYRVIYTDKQITPSLTTIKTRRDDNAKIIKRDNDYKYCFTVPSGFLVFRRNKNIFISGNCGIAGFTVEEIAPLFEPLKDAENVYLPKEFVESYK